MSVRAWMLVASGLATGLCVGRAAAEPAQTPAKRILFFTKSAGFEHPVIKVDASGESLASRTLRQLAEKNGWQIEHTKDGRQFTCEGLSGIAAFVFYASGDLTTPGTDGQPPMTPEGKRLLLEKIHEGTGFVGIHAAADAFHSPGNRYAHDGAATDPYVRMLGGEFVHHGPQQAAPVRVVDRRFPGLSGWPATLDVKEEWYTFKNLAPDVHALLVIDTRRMTGDDYQRPPFPVAWTRSYGKGRIAYTALGHREDVWESKRFQAHLVGALQWALGEKNARIPPNLKRVAPRASDLQPDPAAAKAEDRPTPATN